MILLLLLLPFSTPSEEVSGPEPGLQKYVENSFGLTEKMNVFGMYSLTVGLRDHSDQYFVVLGTTFIIFGGVGVGWKHNFSDSAVSPYTCVTAYGVYTLPAMCPNCGSIPKTRAYASGSAGLEFEIYKSRSRVSHIQLGVLTAYSFHDLAIFESPSDIPWIWPVVNLKISDYVPASR